MHDLTLPRKMQRMRSEGAAPKASCFLTAFSAASSLRIPCVGSNHAMEYDVEGHTLDACVLAYDRAKGAWTLSRLACSLSGGQGEHQSV